MNAHNEQHDPASAVVKQNLTTQPAAAQEAAVWQWRNLRAETGWKDCTRAVYDVFRQNGLHYEVRKLYAAPITAAPADHLHAHLLHMLGAKDHEDACRIIGELHAATMRNPAASGIDLYPIRYALQYAAAAARENTHTELAKDFDELIRKIDASPKGDSEARDAARYRWLREFAVNGSIGIPFHGWLNCDEPASEWDSAIDAAMQAGDAEVQP